MRGSGLPRPRADLTAGAVAALVLLAPAIASAQAYQCRLPGAVSVPRVVPDGPRRNTPVRGYTLALSWSPEFCRNRQGQRPNARQCSGASRSFGLIVHGLWPEAGGQSPQWCAAPRGPSAAEVRGNLCITPSESLLAREWAKHGSCMTRSPATYYRITQILWRGLRLPDLDRMSREQTLTAGFLRTRFAEANKGWMPAAIGVSLSDSGWLRELRLCYDAKFMPKACDPTRYGPRDATRIRIWRGL